MGRFNSPVRPRILRQSSARTSLLLRLGLLLGALLGIHFLRLHFIYQAAVEAKYQATDFGDATLQFEVTEEQLRTRLDLLTARLDWRRLGGGCEGTTYIYDGYVIKTFNPSKPLRNCVPPQQGAKWLSNGEWQQARWPPEIPASILLAGHEDDSANGTGFVPITDFFLATTYEDAQPQWHLVSPLAAGGNLFGLARRLREQGDMVDYRTADEQFRPAFHRVLTTLQSMHDRGLCHDDVKPDNIFIGENDSQWFLGDLGNIRHVSHPYHGSRIWSMNNQVSDCRANDAMRAVKTYLSFLRAASEDGESFDAALLEGSEPWSRLYWMAHGAGATLSASRILGFSQVEEQAAAPAHDVTRHDWTPSALWNPFARLWMGKRTILARAVDDALAMRLGEKWARIFAMTDWLGVPIAPCSFDEKTA